MRVLLGIALVCACGGAPPKTEPPHNGVPLSRPPVAAALTPERVCAAVDKLQRDQCGAFGRTIVMTHDECVTTQQEQPADPKVRAYVDRVDHCLVDSDECQVVSDCLNDLSAPDPNHLRACTDHDPSLAVGVASAEYAQRNGSSARAFSAVKSTKAEPIERCGIENSLRWLTALRCTDGSQPLRDNHEAEAARVGNVGPGGRCGSIIDLYRVTCPDGGFEIFVDAYVCPK